MRLQRVGVSVFGLIAVVSIALALAAVWLFMTQPVTVVNAVNEGEISPILYSLASVVLDTLRGLLRYL